MGKVARRTTRTRATVLTGMVLVGVILLSGCTGDSDDTGEGAPAESTSAAPEVPTKVSVATVTGRLPQPARQRLADQVGAVVDGWFEAAYLGGDYPREDTAEAWADSWPGFTKGAAREARRDAALMSNRSIGADIDDVQALRRVVKLDVLAVKGKAAGVTARVRLRFETASDGEAGPTVAVVGRLYLSPAHPNATDPGWQVFGYDMTKGGA